MIKKQLFLSLLMACCLSLGQLSAQTIKINAYTKCKVALISAQEVKDAGRYGWWSAWQTKKKSKDYKDTPCTFKNIVPGVYTIVVYNPKASTSTDKGDGVVLEKITVGKKFNLKAYYNAGDFRDWNCLSCPWLYVYDGQCFMKKTEILKDVVGAKNKTTTVYEVDPQAIKNGVLKIKIQEEKNEITHLDQVQVRLNGQTYLPQEQATLAQLAHNDGQYQKLKKGDAITLTFQLPAHLKPSDKIRLESTGFYIPDAQFLEAVYQKYLIRGK
ncbi:hypothetical protein [uncultured Microscilla sp.]|uniref:hypothetical protein n=1 Tax=uncultured Microscilla sp. TaxID=432653 RepID=UPI00262D85FB|nr:hypothetical protein [uncultured Microscilla sp.]